jgi:hypothetical protein
MCKLPGGNSLYAPTMSLESVILRGTCEHGLRLSKQKILGWRSELCQSRYKPAHSDQIRIHTGAMQGS